MRTDYFKVKSKVNVFPSENEINRILNHIEDAKSKEIFNSALNYSMSGEMKYIRELVLSHSEGKEFYERIKAINNPVLIYGAGQRGRQLVELFPDILWKGFIDCNKQGTICEKSIFSINDVKEKYSDSSIVISNLLGIEEIVENLVHAGIDKNRLIVLEDYNRKLQEKQYITSEYIDYHNMKYIFDVGGYDGEDTAKFIELGVNKIWLFEPDENMYKECVSRFENSLKVNLVKKGVSNKEQVLRFVLKGGGMSSISEQGDTKIESVCLDNITDNKIDFIKMDIEGEESKALEGAISIICNYAPDMAISVYHKREDIWRLPLQILKYNSKYKFQFSHYSMNQVDTVMYVYGGK